MTRRRVLALALLATLAARGQDPSAGARPPAVLWTLDVEAPSFGGGALADLDGDGRLEVAFGTYFGDARLRVVRGATGQVVFARPSAGGPLDASVAVVASGVDGAPGAAVLVADSANGALWAYDAAGAERWRVDLPSGTDSPVAVADLTGDGRPELVLGTMSVRGGPGCVVALDPRTRETLWSAPLPGHVQTGPALFDLDGDGALEVLAGTWRGDGRLACLDGRTGAERWRLDALGDQYHAPAVGELDGRTGVVACGLGPGDASALVCLEKDGAPRWRKRLEGEYLFAPPLLLDVDGDGALEVLAVGRAAWLYSARGELRWRVPLPGSCARGATPVDLDADGHDDLLLGAGPSLVALRGRDGATLWTFDARAGESPYEAIDTPILLGDLAGDGALAAFFVCGAGSSDAPEKNYGRAYALRLPGARAQPWPTFRGSARQTGCANDREPPPG